MKASQNAVTVALAGNPNVGKSTVFNALTGLRQHTGNWPGKTVGSARGTYTYKGTTYTLVDLPGTYSLMAHSAEEEVARDFLCSKSADVTVIVCDATCLLRNLNLVLQTLDITNNAVLCLNMMDEAKRRHITIDCRALSEDLGIPVVPMTARSGKGLPILMEQIRQIARGKGTKDQTPRGLTQHSRGLTQHSRELTQHPQDTEDALVADIFGSAESIYHRAVTHKEASYNRRLLAIDRIVTGRLTGIPLMLLLLLSILWLTTTGANYPSDLLSSLLGTLSTPLSTTLLALGTPAWLHDLLIDGVYRVLSWVVAVMLPPMAIFFPLFTLLEDLGYLPRIAFNLDHCFKRCHACGKQALTMCMGFGCNAVGVTGCRIIDSPRERMIALLTNCFVPCNGRFPTLIALIGMFFVTGEGWLGSLLSAAMLTGLIVLSVVITFAVSRLLSATLLRGTPSAFVLELPPYRPPQVGKVIVRSVLDRTLFVLGRAAAVAAPCGLVIYLMANLHAGGMSLLAHAANWLDPFAKFFGLDGVILLAFILGLPANEIVLPIAVMGYLATNTIADIPTLSTLKMLLVQNGWTPVTALCTMVFSLLHWPCGTTLLSIKKETGSFWWVLVGFLLPTAVGLILCFIIKNISVLLGLC